MHKFKNWFVQMLLKGERGAINIGGVLMMGISMVFVGVGFIFLPIATTACNNILAYVSAVNATITHATFTGLDAITGITPLLILLGFISEAVLGGFLGVKMIKGGGSAKLSPGAMMLTGLSIVFIALGLIMFPIVLDGAATVYNNGGAVMNPAYTGFVAFLLLSPMLVEIGFISASVISGFFGLKAIGAGAGE